MTIFGKVLILKKKKQEFTQEEKQKIDKSLQDVKEGKIERVWNHITYVKTDAVFENRQHVIKRENGTIVGDIFFVEAGEIGPHWAINIGGEYLTLDCLKRLVEYVSKL